jgi:cytidylate kinase
VSTVSAVMAGPIIAIDGPAGSGKSTLSRALCQRLGLDRLDTGAMYRAVAWAALDRGIDPADQEAVGALAESVRLAVGERVTVDGVDVTDAIRGPAVNRTVSVVAANPRVRRAMVERQRGWVAERDGGVVVEGRDIGSVVLPGADVKVYLTAARDERARRRPEEGADALSRRDHLDRTRAVSPLGVAEGAHVIDTTGRTVDDIAEEIAGWL